jgi:hypothetical protein
MCYHDKIIHQLRGGVSPVDGEYWEDLLDDFYCIDCGCDLTTCRIRDGGGWLDVIIICLDAETRRAKVQLQNGDAVEVNWEELHPMEELAEVTL